MNKGQLRTIMRFNIDHIQQCSICGHHLHPKFECTCGTDLFTPYPFRLKQRNCRCPEDTENNPV